MMVVMIVHLPRLILDVLLNRREVLLGGRNVPGFEILCQLIERLGDGIAARRRGRRTGRTSLGPELLYGREICLRG